MSSFRLCSAVKLDGFSEDVALLDRREVLEPEEMEEAREERRV